MGNGQTIGERAVWKNEKVNKWEMPSYIHAGKSPDPPSNCLDALDVLSLKRQLPAFGMVLGGAPQRSFQY